MGFAEEKLIKYINKNLRKFECIRVEQLLLHLPCLTEMDKQEIKAHVAKSGNNISVWELFQRLQIRENWVWQLLDALEEDNMGHLARELREVYNSHLLPPRNNASASANPPAGSNIPRPPESSAPASNLCSSAVPAPSPLHNMWSSSGAQAPSPVPSEALGAVYTSHDMDDYSAPVQETELPLKSCEMVVKPKTTASGPRKPESSKKSAASASKLRDEGEKPTDTQATSATNVSPAPLTRGHVGEKPKEAMPNAPRSSSSDAAGSEQKWDGRQQRPVCVKNGYFGNLNRPTDNGGPPAPAAVCSPGIPSNQPEENSYSSSDSPPLASSLLGERRAEELLKEDKIQGLQGYQNERLLAAPVDASSPFNLQRRFDIGLEGSRGQQEGSGHAAAVDFDESPESGPTGSVPGNLLRRGLAAPPSDVYSSDLKPPIQEGKMPFDEPDGTVTAPVHEEVTLLSNTADWSTPPSRGNGSSVHCLHRDNHIFNSNYDSDVPCKPSVLLSELDEGVAGQLSSPETDPEYSGSSSRFRLSSEFSSTNDPILLSESSQKGQSDELSPCPAVGNISGRSVTDGAGDASPPPVRDNLQDDNSIRNYTFHLAENPSADLTGAPDVLALGTNPRIRSPDTSSGAVPGRHLVQSPTSRPENSEDLLANERDGAAALPPPPPANDYNLLLAVFALACVAAVAFALYKKK
ncbi:mitochondrial antiviral-signaling protein [Elgaria multicarinata webbii]|uniref:mitochondrial antiviral-signaling protein n=1 Tax=Elgaria multicarinata webbii TaxID=159646 RepID=UPI002FCD607B